jgi:hypothetical protein
MFSFWDPYRAHKQSRLYTPHALYFQVFGSHRWANKKPGKAALLFRIVLLHVDFGDTDLSCRSSVSVDYQLHFAEAFTDHGDEHVSITAGVVG